MAVSVTVNGPDGGTVGQVYSAQAGVAFSGASDKYDTAVKALASLRYYLPLSETSGVIAADVAGNARNGAYVGSPSLASVALVPASVAKSPTFSAAAASGVTIDSQRVATLAAQGGSWSLGFVVKTADPGTTGHVIYSETSDSTATPVFMVTSADTAPTARLRIFWRNDLGATVTARYIPAPIYDGQAHHVVISYAAGTFTAYVDGAQVDTWTVTVSATTTTRASWAILRRPTTSGYVTGALGRVWTRDAATTAAEVASLFGTFGSAPNTSAGAVQSYAWSIAKPAQSASTVSSATATATTVPDQPGSYAITCTVTDTQGATGTGSKTFTALEGLSTKGALKLRLNGQWVPVQRRVIASGNTTGGGGQGGANLITAWEDNFTGTGALDTSKWIVRTGNAVPGGPANYGTGEIETNTAATTNVFQDGTSLHIKATSSGGAWTSGRIESVRDDFQPKAGEVLRVEARITLPSVANGSGYWPAFWLLGEGFRSAPNTWPGIGEIDIMESVNQNGIGYGTMHAGTNPGGAWNEPTGVGGSVPTSSPSLHGNPHVYAVEWDRSSAVEELRWYLDGVRYLTLRESDYPSDYWQRATGHGFYVVVNLAMGGAFPNAIAGGVTPVAGTTSGGEMLVDYVRVSSTSGTVAASVSTANLNDDFQRTTFGPEWQVTGDCTIAGGGARIAARQYNDRIDSVERYSLAGKSVSVHALSLPAAASGEAYLQLTQDFDNFAAIGKSGGSLVLRSKVGGVISNVQVAYDAPTMAYWRIAVDAAGALKWQSSADGATWTDRRTLASGGPALTAAHVSLLAGHYGADPDEAAVFDDLRVGAYIPAASTGTAPLFGIDTDRDITYIEGLVSPTFRFGARLHFAGGNMIPSAGAAATIDSGRVAIIRLEPNVGTGVPVLDDFNSGAWDARIDAVAAWLNDPSRKGKSIIVTPFHEMNGTWYEWSGSQNGGEAANAPAKYRSAFRRVVTRLRAAGVGTNVQIGWNFNNGVIPGGLGNWNDYRNYYPGDDVVDIIGVDGYNDGGAWGDVSAVNNGTMGDKSNGIPCYDRVYQVGAWANNAKESKWCMLDGKVKPFAIFETGSRPDTTIGATTYRKGDFIRSIIPAFTNMPNLKTLVYFEVNKQSVDRRVDTDVAGQPSTSSYAAQSLRAVGLDPLWTTVPVSGGGSTPPTVPNGPDSYDTAVKALGSLRYYLPLEETSGTVAADATSNARNGVYTGTPTYAATAVIPSSSVKSPAFATDDAVTIDGERPVTSAVQAGAWSLGFAVKAADPGITNGPIVYSETSGTTNQPVFFVTSADTAPSTRLRVFWRNDAGATIQGKSLNSAIVFDGASHHVVLSYSNGVLLTYVDGVLADTSNVTVSATTTTRATWGAARRTTNSGFLNGSIGRVWTRDAATSAGEVASLYSAFTG